MLKEKVICSACNKSNDPGNKFCIYCGSKIIHKKEEVPSSESYKKVLGSVDGILIALLAKVAKSDGKISSDEAKYIGRVYDKLCSNNAYPNLRDIFKQILSNEKEKLDNIEELCRKLFSLKVTDRYKTDIISMLVELAYIDGSYSTEEENLIVKIVHHLQVDYAEYKKIVARYAPKQKQEKKSESAYTGYLTIDECYEVLKTSKKANNATLKSSYRKLVKEYHSDILKGKDLPQDLIRFAEEKLKAINFAYDKLKKYRDF